MSHFLEDLKKDWDEFKEMGDRLDSETDQMYDYTNTSSPDQIEIESMTATPAAEKAAEQAEKETEA